ncbi:MAG: SDR family NAD(P)-dependent oxidoreductase [Chloroflexi bacterium]|nr:SDR family NAD(P)-dependent oxidoreductase [Chloroflexota bacterium]MDA1147614.1 SDR family NAD(P)-dependent oxidoreductase [Chloroflexota bacterium]
MREFEGKVAVVTGAASGIGRAMADRFAAAGMKVVLADVEERALEGAVTELRQGEHDVLGVLCDVSTEAALQDLADRTIDAYGGVHILCNNAGVVAGGAIVGDRDQYIWEQPLSDWQWTLDVNLWGVIHGVRVFTPLMLAQHEPGHIINTASTAGLTSGPQLGIYGVSKHGVVRLSEALYFHLRDVAAKTGAQVNCSVLCPGGVRTRITGAGRNRPVERLEGDILRLDAGEVDRRAANWSNLIGDSGQDPAEIAEKVFTAINEDQFYILTHDTQDEAVRMRSEQILARRNPELPPSGLRG